MGQAAFLPILGYLRRDTEARIRLVTNNKTSSHKKYGNRSRRSSEDKRLPLREAKPAAVAITELRVRQNLSL